MQGVVRKLSYSLVKGEKKSLPAGQAKAKVDIPELHS